METPPASLITLPEALLEMIGQRLSRRDFESLALAHPSLTHWVRERRTKGSAMLHSSEELRDLRAALRCHPGLTSLQLILVNRRPLRGFASFFSACTNIRELSLWMSTAFEGRGAWQVLAAGCPSLASLSIKCLRGDTVDLYTDLNPLSKLKALKTLTVAPLADDDSISKLTSLTALSLSFPTHHDPCPRHLLCRNCCRPHIEDIDDLEEYIDALPEGGEVVMGAALGRLPLLEELRLDFAAYEEGTGPEALLNRFVFCEQEAAAWTGEEWNAGRLGGGRQQRPWFPSLRRVVLVNAMGPRHFLYDNDIQEEISDMIVLEGMHAHQFHNPCRLYAIFEWCQGLQEVIIQAGIDEGYKEVGQEFTWECPCGGGGLSGEVVHTEATGLAYAVRRPNSPAEGGVRPMCLTL